MAEPPLHLPACVPGDLTGVVLAGGLGRRMAPGQGGTDKGLLPFRGETLTGYTMKRLRPQVASVMISANRSVDRYRMLGAPVVPDVLPGHPGPLAGVHAAGLQCPTQWLLIVPCDAPLVPVDLGARLAAAARDAGARLAVARCDGRTHWTHLLLHRSSVAAIAPFIAAGQRRVEDWCRREGCAVADFDDAEAFINLNTPEDLQARS